MTPMTLLQLACEDILCLSAILFLQQLKMGSDEVAKSFSTFRFKF